MIKTMLQMRCLFALALAMLLSFNATAETIPLAPGQTAATSSNVVVTNGGTLTLFGQPAGVYLPVSLPVTFIANGSTPVYIGSLSPAKPQLVLPPSPGTYSIARPDVTQFGYNLGVVADLVAAPSSGGSSTIDIDQSTSGANAVSLTGSLNGAATAANQASMLTALSNLLTAIGSPLQAGGAVVVSGVATAANQSTANTTLTSILSALSGIATASNQATANTTLSSILAALGSPLQAGGAVVVSGVSTAANQLTGNGSLATIAANTTGASTASNQATANATLSSILSALGSPLQAGGSVTISGVATSANQSTGNTALSSILTSLGAIQKNIGSAIFNRSLSADARGYQAANPTQIWSGTYAGYTSGSPTDMICLSEQTAGHQLIVAQANLQISSTSATFPSNLSSAPEWIKRITLDSGGTSTTPSALKYDSNDSGAISGVLTVFTQAPTLGASAGVFAYNPVATSALTAAPATFSLTTGIGAGNLQTYYEPVTLHYGESLCFYWDGQTQPAGFSSLYNFQAADVPSP